MQAIKKLEQERNDKKKKLSSKANAVSNTVYEAVCTFCRQHAEFAQAVEQTDKTFQECCEACVKGVGNAISDLEVYRRAVQFYFTGADVQFHMQVQLPGDPPQDEPASTQTQPHSGIMLSLDELLDF